MPERNTNETTKRMATARNAVQDFVTARAASIPTAASNITLNMTYRTGDVFIAAILDALPCDVKSTKQ
jgi:hypothetical protein